MKGGIPGILHAWRVLARYPGFLAVAALNLGLGVAAATGAFALVDSLVLHRPPFPDHARVVLYGEHSPGGPVRYASPIFFDDVGMPAQIESRGIARLPESVNADVAGNVVLASAQRMDAGFLPTLGVSPEAGEGLSGAPDEAVVSHGFWRRMLHADLRAIGTRITVNGRPTVIRGVLSPDYRLFTDVDLFLPLHLAPHAADNAQNMTAVARLRPGVGERAFSDHVHAVAAAHAAALRIGPDRLPFYGATWLDDQVTGLARPTVLLFFSCALAVMAIAGLNLSSLLLIRAVARSHGTALRIALGARGWRPWIPAVGEALLVGILAVAAGLSTGNVVAHVFASLLPAEWLISHDAIAFDWHAWVFGIALALVTLAVAVVGGSVHETSGVLFRERFASGRAFGTKTGRHARRVMNVVQTAIAVMLLAWSIGVITRWWDLEHVPMGFDTAQAQVFEIKADDAQFPTVVDVNALFLEFSGRLLAQRGIRYAGMSNHLPGSGSFVMPFALPDGSTYYAQYGLATPGALQAMGLRLLSGRHFDAGDVGGAGRVAMVNEAYLKTFGSGGVGDEVWPASRLSPNAPLRIVGVVADTRHAGPGRPPEPTVFIPLAQAWESSFDFVRLYMPMYVIVRGPDAEGLSMETASRELHRTAPFVAVAHARSMRDDARQVMAGFRRDAVISAILALFAMFLACIGLYSSESVDVMSRRRDYAVHGALGATPMDLAMIVLARNVAVAMIGTLLGMGCTLLAHRSPLQTMLHIQLEVAVPACVAMLAVAVIASVIPAWRAARIDPLHAIHGA